jgi:hypothetical protein
VGGQLAADPVEQVRRRVVVEIDRGVEPQRFREEP